MAECCRWRKAANVERVIAKNQQKISKLDSHAVYIRDSSSHHFDSRELFTAAVINIFLRHSHLKEITHDDVITMPGISVVLDIRTE